jgi:hypothetical protein
MNHPLDAHSKQNRLTCHPVGPPLSAVGFTNAKTQPGASALLRDNDLLSRPRTSNHKKNQKQSPASPVCPASPDLQVGLPDNHPVSHPPQARRRIFHSRMCVVPGFPIRRMTETPGRAPRRELRRARMGVRSPGRLG